MASLMKRGKVYYARYWVGKKQKTVCLQTRAYPIAKEKLRGIESSLAQGSTSSLPGKTPIGKVLSSYIAAMKTTKTASTVRSEFYYLRVCFGPVCPELETVPVSGANKRKKDAEFRIENRWFEGISTPQIVTFILERAKARGLSPKTCNHYRAILSRVFSWAMSQYGVKMPNDVNPATRVKRYRERARTIRFLTLPQIDEQLAVLENAPTIQAMVAVYIYAGLRREEALWLTQQDFKLDAGPHGVIQVQAKTVNGETWGPKTKDNRIVPISRTLRRYLV